MPYCLGAKHVETPAYVPSVSQMHAMRLGPPPAAVDWHRALPPDGEALGNDRYGCCVPCAEYQAIALRRAVVWGDNWRPTADMTLARYGHLTGFDRASGRPDDGTQTGLSMGDWGATGIRLDTQNLDVVHWLSIPRRAIANIKQAIALLGPVQLSLNMPAALQDDASVPWALPHGTKDNPDWLPGSWGGHRVVCGRYEGDVFTVRSWGLDIPMSLEFWLTYGLSADATLSREWFDSRGIAGSGQTWDSLSSELDTLRA